MIRLVCLDMDGVLVQERNFWMLLHDAYGTREEGERLTEQYLHTNYGKLVEGVGALWRGKPAGVYLDLVQRAELMPGIESLFRELDTLNVPRAIITSGPYELADRIKELFGVNFIFANQPLIADGFLTGEFKWPVHSKREIVEQLCDDLDILPQDVLYLGDSDSDIEAFRIVGVSVAIDGSSQLRAAATYAVQNLEQITLLLQELYAQQNL